MSIHPTHYQVTDKIFVEIVDVGGESPIAAVYLDDEYVDEIYLESPDKDIPVILESLSCAISSANPEYYAVCETIEQICERLEGEQ